MPRNVRNYWIEADIDGKKTGIATGPRSKDGGFTMRIYQRDDGDVTHAIRIEGCVGSEGKLTLMAFGKDGQRMEIETQR